MMEEVQRRALAEPFQLRRAEGVVEPERLACSVRALDAAFAVIVVADGNPLDPMGLVVPSNLADRLSLFAGEDVDPGTGLAIEGVGRAHEHVVAELIQVAAVTQPRTGGRDVVRRGLAFG